VMATPDPCGRCAACRRAVQAITEQATEVVNRYEPKPVPDGIDPSAVPVSVKLSVSPNRQGWRARLANVERLLAASLDSKTPRQAAETVADALAEIRAMIDGDGE
jgi:hypothetical protein